MPENREVIGHPHQGSRFCMHCGSALKEQLSSMDTMPRLICTKCKFVHYINPRPAAGLIPIDTNGRILLARRDIEPQLGSWVFPGGFIDIGETVEEAAVRETREEVCLEVQNLQLIGVYTRITAGVIITVFTAEALGTATAAHETAEVKWFEKDNIPWSELAFETTTWALEEYLKKQAFTKT